MLNQWILCHEIMDFKKVKFQVSKKKKGSCEGQPLPPFFASFPWL